MKKKAKNTMYSLITLSDVKCREANALGLRIQVDKFWGPALGVCIGRASIAGAWMMLCSPQAIQCLPRSSFEQH